MGSRRSAGTANSKRPYTNSHQTQLFACGVYASTKYHKKNIPRLFVFSLFSPENKKGERGVNLAIVDGNSVIIVGISSLKPIRSSNTVVVYFEHLGSCMLSA